MRIQRHKLKLLIEAMINEGQAEDLIAANPELQPAYDMGVRNHVYLRWLSKNLGTEPIEDVVPVIQAFDKMKQRLAKKDINAYNSVGELRLALEEIAPSRGEIKTNEVTDLGQFGPWTVVMPHTREASILLGKATTWCTAATKSGNLFYNYVARPNENIVLYYIINSSIKDLKSDPDGKLSVGFVNGNPILDGKRGGLSVNANNKGLDKARLEEILGDNFDLIMKAMSNHSAAIGGEHPAKSKMKQLAQSKDGSALDKLTQGMNVEERSDFMKIFTQYDLSLEILTKLSIDENVFIRRSVARNRKTPPEILLKMSDDEDSGVRSVVTTNPNITPEILVKLSNDEDSGIRKIIAYNPNAPVELLAKMSDDEDSGVRKIIAYNPNITPEILVKMSDDDDSGARKNVAINPNTPAEILVKLSDDENSGVRSNVAYNRKTPTEILVKLSDDEDPQVRKIIAYNPNTPADILVKLSTDKNLSVREAVGRNPKTPVKILVKLSVDKKSNVRAHVAQNPTYKAYIESSQQISERLIRLAGTSKFKYET